MINELNSVYQLDRRLCKQFEMNVNNSGFFVVPRLDECPQASTRNWLIQNITKVRTTEMSFCWDMLIVLELLTTIVYSQWLQT